MTERMSVEHWLAIRKAEALKIDPEAAEVFWTYGQVVDPYGIDPDLPEEWKCIGRVYFARRPGSEIWVCFDDLPRATEAALWERHESELAFPAGLLFDPAYIASLRLIASRFEKNRPW